MVTELRTIQPRRDTYAAWVEENPVPKTGELLVETDTGKMRLGNGIHTFTQLKAHLPEDLIQALIDSAVGPLVTAALASSTTVTDAAAAAAGQAVADAGIVKGMVVIPAGFEDVAFAIMSQTQQRTWLEVSSVDGGPTDYAKSILSNLFATAGSSGPFETQKLFAEVVGSAPNRDIFVTDADSGARTAIATAGDNYEPMVLADPYNNSEGVVTFKNTTGASTFNQYWRRSNSQVRPLMADPLKYVMWGDSLTYRGGVIAALQAKMSDVAVVNRGVGSQRSDEIFARQGGLIPVTTGPVTIPASGSVTVPFDITFAWNAEETSLCVGSLMGVPGTVVSPLTDATKVHTFTRTTDGAAVVVPIGTQWIQTLATTHENDTAIFWTGRNDVTQGKSAQTVIDNTRKAIARLRTLYKRVLVVSTTQATTETIGTAKYNVIKAINDALRVEPGIRFADVQSYLVDNAYTIMTQLGITPTTADNTAIAGDTLPPSFVPAGDILHHTPAIQTVIGNYLFDSHIKPIGWHA